MTFEEIRAAFGDYTAVDDSRQRLIHYLVRMTSNLGGSMAEIGVYKGGTSYLIANTDPRRPLFSCDSFEGLPKPGEMDTHLKGDFSDVSYESVIKKLHFPQVQVIKGFFPDTQLHGKMLSNEFSFVHIDVDLYASTLECLKVFYDRMVLGGIVVVDDYGLTTCPGIKQSVDEFMVGKPETLITTGQYNCYFRKR